MEKLLELIQTQFEYSFTWMLIHSIWVGAILVLLLLLFNILFQFNVKVKHTLSKWVLFIFCFITFFTFLFSLFTASDLPFSEIEIWPLSFLEIQPSVYSLIILLWSVGFCFYTLRYFLGMVRIKQIIRNSSSEFPIQWLSLYAKLQLQFAIKNNITLRHSQDIGSAFMKGILKPVIVVPTSWVNNLSYEETQFILTHEFAHILRKDHWTNIMICYAEIIFFFNPAIRFLISRIRLERELCADEYTAEQTNKPLQYASLLIKLEESLLNYPSFLIGFLNEKLHLTRRVWKITGQHYTILFPWKLVFFFGILTCFIGFERPSSSNLSAAYSKVGIQNSTCYNVTPFCTNLNPILYVAKQKTTFHKSPKLKVQNSSIGHSENTIQNIIANEHEIKPNPTQDDKNVYNPEVVINSAMIVGLENGVITFHANEGNRDIVYSIIKEPVPDKYEIIKQFILKMDKSNAELRETKEDPGTILHQEIETNIN